MCQTCTLGLLGAVTLQSPLGVLDSPLLPSSLFLRMECTHPLEEIYPLGCLHIRHTQGPLCQARPCHLLDSSLQGPTLGSRQCHLPDSSSSSSQCQVTQDTKELGLSPPLCPQPSLEGEAPSQMLLALTPCETPRSCERL